MEQNDDLLKSMLKFAHSGKCFTYVEIAKALGVSMTTVQKIETLALMKLRRKIIKDKLQDLKDFTSQQ